MEVKNLFFYLVVQLPNYQITKSELPGLNEAPSQQLQWLQINLAFPWGPEGLNPYLKGVSSHVT